MRSVLRPLLKFDFQFPEKMPFLELEIACSGLPFDHVIDPLGPSDAALQDASHSGGDSIRFENFFKKIFDFLPDTKVSLGPGEKCVSRRALSNGANV